jgi:hypothetical protein
MSLAFAFVAALLGAALIGFFFGFYLGAPTKPEDKRLEKAVLAAIQKETARHE